MCYWARVSWGFWRYRSLFIIIIIITIIILFLRPLYVAFPMNPVVSHALIDNIIEGNNGLSSESPHLEAALLGFKRASTRSSFLNSNHRATAISSNRLLWTLFQCWDWLSDQSITLLWTDNCWKQAWIIIYTSRFLLKGMESMYSAIEKNAQEPQRMPNASLRSRHYSRHFVLSQLSTVWHCRPVLGNIAFYYNTVEPH